MNWNDYTTKTALKDNDELMILDKDANANKRTLMDKIWNYVVDKMTTAVIAKLGTTNKTLIGAVNELNSNKYMFRTDTKETSPNGNIYFSDLPIDTYNVIAIYRIDEPDSIVIPCSYFSTMNNKAYNGGHITNSFKTMDVVSGQKVTVFTVYVKIK